MHDSLMLIHNLTKCAGSFAIKLFCYILYNIPPYIPKPTSVARTIEPY